MSTSRSSSKWCQVPAKQAQELRRGNFASFNLRRLLTTENATSTFLQAHEIVFKIINSAIVPFVYGRRINLVSSRSNFEADLTKRLLGVNGTTYTCINGFVLGDLIQKNPYFSYYSECPELIRMLDHILP